MISGRHGGRASDHAGSRDLACDESMTSWVQCPYGVFSGLEIGKVYVFHGGRKGKLIAKKDNAQHKGGLPMIKVEWRS